MKFPSLVRTKPNQAAVNTMAKSPIPPIIRNRFFGSEREECRSPNRTEKKIKIKATKKEDLVTAYITAPKPPITKIFLCWAPFQRPWQN